MRTVIIAAVTIDGKIARHRAHNVDWTSSKDKNFFRSETKKAGAVIFGRSTYKAMGTYMKNRLNVIMTRSPQNYAHEQREGILEFTSDAPRVVIDKLIARGYSKVVIGGGSEIYSLFLEKGLIDEIYLTIAPKIFGGGVNLFKEMQMREMQLELYQIGRLGEGEVLLKYKVKK